MSQGPLCPNLTKKGQAEVSQMANRNLSRVILLGGLSVNINNEYYLTFVKVSKNGTQYSTAHSTHLSVLASESNWPMTWPRDLPS